MAPTLDFGQNPPSIALEAAKQSLVVHALVHTSTTKLIACSLPYAKIVASTTASTFAKSLQCESADVAIVDPSLDGDVMSRRVSAHPLVRALAVASAPPFVIYLSDGRPLALRSALYQLGPVMIAVRGMDDTPDQMRSIIEDAMRSRVPEQLMAILEDSLACLRPEIVNALGYALRSPLDCDSVELLARAAGLSSRVLRGEITAAGFAPPRTWLVAARVLRAHWEFRKSPVRVHHVVANMGYSGDAPLAHDIARMTRLTASEFRRRSTREILSMIADRLAQPLRRIADTDAATCLTDRTIPLPLASAG